MWNFFRSLIVKCAQFLLLVFVLLGIGYGILRANGMTYDPTPILSYARAKINGQERTCLDVIASGENYRDYSRCTAEFAP